MLYTLITAAAVAFMAPTTVLQSSVQVRAARVEMNTQYTVAAGLAKKGPNKAKGSLLGYKVGNRAPEGSKSSGSTKKEADAMTKLKAAFDFGAGKKNTRDTGPKKSTKTGSLKGYTTEQGFYGKGMELAKKSRTKRI
mmetsp:Transcript_15152/g.25787  ORF Transcript_15152/g.25787 Transcript_15152/m.25787 type:complete len:137 (+) Transcript_15152:54-464(+)